jgi:hypothetical protein
MPEFSSVDVLFKRTTEGWTFNSPYPRLFGRPSTYLLTNAQKSALQERLNRLMLMSLVLAFVLAGLGDFTLIIVVPDFGDEFRAGSPVAWLLVGVVGIVVASAFIPAIFFIRHRVIEPVLCTARCLGPAQPQGLGILIEMIKRYTERKSVKAMIIWIALLLFLSAYNTIVDTLVVRSPSFLMLFTAVLTWLVTLCYATLLVFKLRAQRSGLR